MLASTVTGWIYCAVVAAVWAAMMVWQLAKLKKTTDVKGKSKSKIAIALVMLLPFVASVVGFIWGVSTTGW